MFEDVSQAELDQELLNEAYETIEEFMDSFVDNEADALSVDVQIRRVIMNRLINKN